MEIFFLTRQRTGQKETDRQTDRERDSCNSDPVDRTFCFKYCNYTCNYKEPYNRSVTHTLQTCGFFWGGNDTEEHCILVYIYCTTPDILPRAVLIPDIFKSQSLPHSLLPLRNLSKAAALLQGWIDAETVERCHLFRFKHKPPAFPSHSERASES